MLECRMRAGGNQVGDAGARIVPAYERLPHEDDVRPALGVLDDVVRPAYARLGDLDHTIGDQRRQAFEGAAVDLEGLEVAGVDTDQIGTRVDRTGDLFLVVHLDQWGEADR